MDITNALQNLQTSVNPNPVTQKKPSFDLNAPQPKAAANSYAETRNNNSQNQLSKLPNFTNVDYTTPPAYTNRGQLVNIEA